VLIKTTINWESSLCNFVWSRLGAKRFISPLMIIIKSVFSINLYIYIYIYILNEINFLKIKYIQKQILLDINNNKV
jgi:hypothetical protein